MIPRRFFSPGCEFFRAAVRLAIAALVATLGAAEPPRADAVLPVDPARGEFTVVLLPDTQRYAKHTPAMFLSQTRWIRENVAALAIRFVIHLGDIVDDNTDAEWRVADEAMGLLDGVVPYTVLPGNHDFEKSEDGRRVKLAPKYNAVFPPLRFRHQPGYGGHRGVTNENNYSFFSAGGRNFLVLAL
ncbi:MAG: metallophosphoesterase, partial [Verrucomicrobia bacterium]|nr:metallophosphoesterase [Verrucomicrobiota bacterium]